MTEPVELAPFEGLPVVGAAIEIPNAGGGFQDAMELTPIELHHGQRVTVVMDCFVRRIKHDYAKKSDDELIRVHVLTAELATIVDRSEVAKLLEDQADRNRLAREAAEGIVRLPMGEDAYDSPEDAHAAGEHASGLHPGCGECNAEAAVAEAEHETKMWGPTSGSGTSNEGVVVTDPALDLPKGPGLHSVPDPEKPAKGKKATTQ